jgi:hypothetical protein
MNKLGIYSGQTLGKSDLLDPRPKLILRGEFKDKSSLPTNVERAIRVSGASAIKTVSLCMREYCTS